MIDATGLMVFYENMLALNNGSIKCNQNQIVGIFGANSAGKSTLMYTLSGIIEDIRKKEDMAGGERVSVLGKINYLGEEIMGLKPSRRAKKGLILCPERRRIFKECTVLENLRIGGYLASSSQAKGTLEYVFKIFPALEKLQNRIGGFLSGGEQQRVSIARALVNNPSIILADEPTGNMDQKTGKEILSLFNKLNDEGHSIVMVTHDPEVARNAKEIIILQDGQIVERVKNG